MDWIVPTLLGMAILGLVAWRSVAIMRRERGQRPGAAPGSGRHFLRSEYASGVGGGEAKEYSVPRDPQDYARLFVPKDKHGR